MAYVSMIWGPHSAPLSGAPHNLGLPLYLCLVNFLCVATVVFGSVSIALIFAPIINLTTESLTVAWSWSVKVGPGPPSIRGLLRVVHGSGTCMQAAHGRRSGWAGLAHTNAGQAAIKIRLALRGQLKRANGE